MPYDTAGSAFSGTAGFGAVERRLLGVMPLHAVTDRHGEGGLRERLVIEAGRLPAAGRGRVLVALEWMGRLHAGDRRQREPYACHPLRVAIRVLSHYRVDDPDVACAALLHDTVEDHAGELAPGGSREDAVAGEFGGRVASLVGAVTSPVWAPGSDRHVQYRAHVTASLEGCPWARVVKVSDFTDNAVGLFHTTGGESAAAGGEVPAAGAGAAGDGAAGGHAAGRGREGDDRPAADKADGRLAVLTGEDETC